jgi:hypothetical protein
MSWRARSRDNKVGIEAGCGLDKRVVGVPIQVGANILCFPCRLDRFRGSPRLSGGKPAGT